MMFSSLSLFWLIFACLEVSKGRINVIAGKGRQAIITTIFIVTVNISAPYFATVSIPIDSRVEADNIVIC